jgi:hypothetical protein
MKTPGTSFGECARCGIQVMTTTVQCISFVLVAFFLFFAADGRGSTFFYDNQSETSTDDHQESSPDECTIRVSFGTLPYLSGQLRFRNRYLDKRIYGSVVSAAPVVKIPADQETSPSAARRAFVTTVLRI